MFSYFLGSTSKRPQIPPKPTKPQRPVKPQRPKKPKKSTFVKKLRFPTVPFVKINFKKRSTTTPKPTTLPTTQSTTSIPDVKSFLKLKIKKTPSQTFNLHNSFLDETVFESFPAGFENENIFPTFPSPSFQSPTFDSPTFESPKAVKPASGIRHGRGVKHQFKPSFDEGAYLDNLVGKWVPGFIPDEYHWKGMSEK